tara:strand:+ start:379 stop:537 length:159 start_codon:yes stop_codon:yes gene_type:complete
MLKMLLDPMGGIVLTNDGNAILREVSNQSIQMFNHLCNFFIRLMFNIQQQKV